MDFGNLYDADLDDENQSQLHQYLTQPMLQQDQEQRNGDPNQNKAQLPPGNASERNSLMGLNNAPPDQIYYQQVMGPNATGTSHNN